MSDGSASGFGKYVPGFDFLQGLASQAAGGIAQGIGQNLPPLPSLGHWVAPTFNVEELEKRIEELRAVQFWLDQNAKALGATIQALEVQKMTLSTLKSMNVSLGEVAQAFKGEAADAAPAKANRFAGLEVPPRTYGSAPAPQAPRPSAARRTAKAAQSPPSAATETSAGGAPGAVDPMQWWGALTQQFQQIATNALKDAARQGALDATRQAASGLTGAAVKTATGLAEQAARTAADTVGRGVGAATGIGRAAAKAVAGAASAPAPKAPRKAAPRRSR